jgi:transglutaminase-like putative cysteine protease
MPEACVAFFKRPVSALDPAHPLPQPALSMIYTVRHVTRYEYGGPIDLGAHMLHLQPRALPWQRVLRAALVASPKPGRIDTGRDCFGNDVSWMFVDTPHPRFEVALEAQVEVAAPPPPDADATLCWTQVAAMAAAGGDAAHEAAEFLFESPLVASVAEVRSYAECSFPAQRPILHAVLDLNQRIKRDFAFRAGVTNVHTPVRQVMAQRAGVCQDFSHLMIAGLRALGLPARYVSGYVRTWPPAGQKRRIGADQSHAWVGCWLGPEHGWIDLDPTNGLVIADEHVVLGWGRDFTDVTPMCGVILGGASHQVHVSVDLAPEA